MQAPLLTQTALPFQGLDLLHDFAHLCESALDVLPQVMFVLSALLFIGEGCAVRGRLPLLSECLRMQGMREGRRVCARLPPGGYRSPQHGGVMPWGYSL